MRQARCAACLIRRVNHLDVIGLVPGHHLIAGNAIEYGVHDGPLRRGFAPAALGFLQAAIPPLWPTPRSQCSLPSMTKMRLQTMKPGLETPLIVPPPKPEIHGRLTLADGALLTADEVGRGRRPGDEQDPDVIIHAACLDSAAPSANRAACFPAESPVCAKGDRSPSHPSPAHSSTSLKCGIGFAGEKNAAVFALFYRRPIDIVEQSLRPDRWRAQGLSSPC